MSDTITKLLFRRGTDVQRRTAGGTGVTFNVGEPAFCLDTNRLYIGDSNNTVGGVPIGMRNHGAFANVFGAGPGGLDNTTFTALTTNGVDVGDILFDNSSSILYYVNSKVSTAAAPTSGQLTGFSLQNQIQAWNYDTSTHIISTYGPTTYAVGIGCAPTIQGLTIKGTSTTTDALSVVGNIHATGSITADTPSGTLSDIRFKKNIELLPNALNKVLELRGVSFDWNYDSKTGHDVGVIAQEVEKVLPEAICPIENAAGGKTVYYEKLIPLLIEAIKELANR